MRRTIPVLIVVGLAVVVALLLINRDDDAPPDTLADATTTTSSVVTTTVPESTTTTTMGTSTTAATEVDVVETVEEAEAILRELWFGWFEGIYNEDEDRIREVVVLEETVEQARESFGLAEFQRAPSPGDISFADTQILRADEQCLAVWTVLMVDGFSEPGSSPGVEVIRWTPDGWKSLSTWTNRDDLWEADCESSLF